MPTSPSYGDIEELVELHGGSSPGLVLYNIGNKWAGYQGNIGRPVLPVLETANDRLPQPATPHTVMQTAARLEQQRQARIDSGQWHSPAFHAKQQWRGIRSGEVRKAKTAAPYAKVWTTLCQGISQREASRIHDVPLTTVNRIKKRFEQEPPARAADPDGGCSTNQRW